MASHIEMIEKSGGSILVKKDAPEVSIKDFPQGWQS